MLWTRTPGEIRIYRTHTVDGRPSKPWFIEAKPYAAWKLFFPKGVPLYACRGDASTLPAVDPVPPAGGMGTTKTPGREGTRRRKRGR